MLGALVNYCIVYHGRAAFKPSCLPPLSISPSNLSLSLPPSLPLSLPLSPPLPPSLPPPPS